MKVYFDQTIVWELKVSQLSSKFWFWWLTYLKLTKVVHKTTNKVLTNNIVEMLKFSSIKQFFDNRMY